ncbi:ABC transporter ATP-binding protein [Haliangium sp.]|uniref:ABC transporter ATP-binding protein n=1 Tax=Haliangium sp. TaxID=2663208 RepID=UPI003D0A47BE
MSPAAAPAPPPLVDMRGISKRFPGVQALTEVDYALAPGEVHALLGENGAGKSTLMGVLSGMVSPDAGVVHVDGRAVRLRSPRDALALGIGMVHQHVLCAERHSVLDNIALGWSRLPFVPNRSALRAAVTEAIAPYRLDLAEVLDAHMHALPVGVRQKVEIARALLFGARVLVLDEPTAVLSRTEAEALLALVRDFTTRGGGVIFISHKLDEVLAVSDHITVLRRGRCVARRRADATSAAELAVDMLGASEPPDALTPTRPRRPAPVDINADADADPASDIVLALAGVDVAGPGPRGAGGLSGIDLELRRGQILGVAGVAGSGQQALAELLAGHRAPVAGTLTLFGRARRGRACSPRAFADAGVGYIPADRKQTGVAGDLSVADNLLLRRYRRDFVRRGLLTRARARAWATELIHTYDIQCDGPDARAADLSGGNLQKVIVARELASEPGLLVAAYPFRGLDIGAARGVRERLHAAREGGAAVILISEDLDPLFALADHIGVLFRGRLVALAEREALTREQVGLWMGGHVDVNASDADVSAGAPP